MTVNIARTGQKVLAEHRDWYLRDNAAYALGRMLPKADRAKLVAELESSKLLDDHGWPDTERDRYHHLYAFGRGLISRGDDSGIVFCAFRYSIYNANKGLSEIIYMLSQRVNVLADARSAKLAEFFEQAFADGHRYGSHAVGRALYDRCPFLT